MGGQKFGLHLTPDMLMAFLWWKRKQLQFNNKVKLKLKRPQGLFARYARLSIACSGAENNIFTGISDNPSSGHIITIKCMKSG